MRLRISPIAESLNKHTDLKSLKVVFSGNSEINMSERKYADVLILIL